MAEPSVRSTLTHMHILCIYKSYVLMTVLIIILHRCGLTPFYSSSIVRSWDARPLGFRVVATFDPHIRNLS